MIEKQMIESDERVLATDLDGTLIPLQGDHQNRSDLQTLAEEFLRNDVSLIFVTGRHLGSVTHAIDELPLPSPQWLICDVGTSIFQRQASGEYEAVTAYWQHQQQIIAALPMIALRERLRAIDGLRLQEQEKQGQFKLSFYADAAELSKLVDRVQQTLDQILAPYRIIHSVDPFNGDGLIDLLPTSVSKAYALAWWSRHTGRRPEEIVFAGDSGNDLAALTAGYRSIVVGNADRRLARQVYDAHLQAGWHDRLYLASGKATSGVLEGCRWFGLAEPAKSTSH